MFDTKYVRGSVLSQYNYSDKYLSALVELAFTLAEAVFSKARNEEVCPIAIPRELVLAPIISVDQLGRSTQILRQTPSLHP